MELTLCRETHSCYRALPPLTGLCEQSAETIVPDYCPDIARIVESSGCFTLRSHDLADGRVSVSGTLKVTVLYIADGSGGIRSFTYPLAVEKTLDGKIGEDCRELCADGSLVSLEVRALNPRKLSTRAAVELTATPYCALSLSVCGAVEQAADFGVETRVETKDVSLIKAVRRKEFLFTDELLLAANKESAAELLRRRIALRTTECRVIGGKCALKGVASIELLYLSEGGTICRTEAELPFSQLLEGIDGADENTTAEAALRLTDAELRIGGESDDARTISVKLFLHACVVLRQRLKLRCVTDLYSTSHVLTPQLVPLELCADAQTVTQEQPLRMPIETGVEVAAVLSAEASFTGLTLVQEEASATARCIAAVRVLYLDEGGAPLLVERQEECSARVAVPQGCAASQLTVTAGSLSAVPSAGGIELRGTALFTLRCEKSCRCPCLTALAAEPQKLDTGEQPSLVLRAPHAGEDLWALAKEYRTTAADILSANDLASEAELPADTLLLIPRRR